MKLTLANVTPLGPSADTYEEAFAAMQRTAMTALERRHAEANVLDRRLRDRTGEATALLGGAWAQIVDGDPRPAIAPLQRCLEILHPWHPQERRLIQGAAGNLVLCYIDVDRPQDAYDTVVLAKPYFEDCTDTILLLRWDWQWGKADRDRGHFFSAELLLKRVRDGFEEEGLAEEIGEVCLDLAMLYARQGRRGEFLRAITEATEIFRSIGARREYLAAIGQLNALAQHEEAAVAVLRQLVLECRGGVHRAEP